MNGIVRGSNFAAEVQMVVETCCNCGMPFAMTKDFKKEKLDARGGKGQAFYCPAGHQQHYVGESEETKLRRERDRLKQNQAWYEERNAQLRDEAKHERHRANGYKGHATKLRKRAKAGICPCCNRHFEQLQRHMANQHPEFTPELSEEDPPMRGEVSTGRKRNSHPLDWCVDESWVAWQLFKALGDFAQEKGAGEAIWDPSAGSGRTMVTFAEAGFAVFASDIVRRINPLLFAEAECPEPAFFSADFLEQEAAPAPCSIVHNPPYSYIENIAESFVRQALKLATRRVCAVLPLKWLGSQGRYALFAEDHPPQAVLVLTQRPSMPPGDMIEALEAEGKAFKGAVVDYAWYVWNVQHRTAPGQTRAIWLPPLDRPELLLPIEGLA